HLVAQPGRLLEQHGGASRLHLGLHLADQLLFFAFQDESQGANLFAVILFGDAEIARGRTLADAVQEARPEPAPALVVGVDVELTGAKLKDALQHLNRGAQTLGAGERPVEPDTAAARRARELDAREILPCAN